MFRILRLGPLQEALLAEGVLSKQKDIYEMTVVRHNKVIICVEDQICAAGYWSNVLIIPVHKCINSTYFSIN